MRYIVLVGMATVFVLLGATACLKEEPASDVILLDTNTSLAHVYFVPDPNETQLFGELILYRGEADMTGSEGVAHYFEHLVAWNALSERDGSRQRDFNASTTKTYTNYYMNSIDHSLVMRYLSGVFAPITLDANYMLEERGIVRSEYMLRVSESKYFALFESFNTEVYQHTGMARSVIGKPAEIAALDPADEIARISPLYVPANAAILLRGNLTVKQATKLVQEYFGKTDSSSVTTTDVKAVHRPLAEQQFQQHKMQRLSKTELDIPHSVALSSWLFNDQDLPDSRRMALRSMISFVLSSRHKQMIARKLVDEDKDYAGIDGSFSLFPGALGSEFRLQGNIRDGRGPAYLSEALVEWLQLLKKAPELLKPAMEAKVMRTLSQVDKNTPKDHFASMSWDLKNGYTQPIIYAQYLQELEALTPQDVIGYLERIISSANDVSRQFLKKEN